MAVTSISPIAPGRGGGKAKDGRNSYVRGYIIRTDSTYDEAGVVMAACPSRVGDTYSNGAGFTDAKSFCVRLRPEPDSKDPCTWRVYADFEPKTQEELGRLTITGRFEKKKVAMVGVRSQSVDQYGQSTGGQVTPAGYKIVKYESTVANSFGDPFDPAPEYEVSYPVISITRVEQTLKLPVLMYFKDAINNAPWAGVPAGCAKMMSIEFRHEYRYVNQVEKKLWWITYNIGLDPDTWVIQKLDAGYHYYSGTADPDGGGKVKAFFDTDGTTPRIGLLSNEVAAVGTQKGIKLADLTKPEFKYFQPLPERSFSLLNLPTDLNLLDYPPVP